MDTYSTSRQGLHQSDSADDDFSDLDFGINQFERPTCTPAEIAAMLEGLDDAASDSEAAKPAQTTETIAPLHSLLAGWQTEQEAFRAKQAAFRALFLPVPRPAGENVSLSHPSSYGWTYGVSHRTVARRRKAGVVALDDLLKPTKSLVLDDRRYSAREFAKTFKISDRIVLAGIKAGKTAAEILESRRPRGRPSRAK